METGRHTGGYHNRKISITVSEIKQACKRAYIQGKVMGGSHKTTTTTLHGVNNGPILTYTFI